LLPDLVPALKVNAGRMASRASRFPALHAATGQQLRGALNASAGAGFDVVSRQRSHFCCGSAGTYSLLQPDLALALRDRKLDHLAKLEPHHRIGEIGLHQHLQSGTAHP